LTDVTHDEVDDGFHEIHLSGKQLFALFMATVVVSVVIFLIGVFVGRNVRSQQASTAEHLSDSTAAITPAPGRQPAPVAADSAPQAAEPPVPPAETDELSYKRRLEGQSSAESLKSPAPVAVPPSPRAAPSQPGAATLPPAQQAAGTIGTPQPGTWVIQIHVLRDRAAANGIVRRLVGKGYPAFLVAAGPPTGSYKVQVGRYKARDEAQKVIERLKKEEQFNPWITR
jgi:cell division septation protein DedD